MISPEELAVMEQRARRFSGAYTGTSGTLAAAVLTLLKDRREILESRQHRPSRASRIRSALHYRRR
jgi:hypothetical protein